jgi:hypothetical protein
MPYLKNEKFKNINFGNDVWEFKIGHCPNGLNRRGKGSKLGKNLNLGCQSVAYL